MLFEKGHKKIEGSGCKKGQKHSTAAKALKDAMQLAEEKKGISLLDSICQRAYDDGPLAIAILRKLLPDLKQVAVERHYEGGFAEMTPAEAVAEMDKLTIGLSANEPNET